MKTSRQHVCGVHLVGSVPFDNCSQVFKKVSEALGSHLRRLPDGETGERSDWILWQLPILQENPNLELISNETDSYAQIRQVRLREGCDSKKLQLADAGYAKAAFESYEEFRALKVAGEIPSHCRFQVCLPTPLATTHFYVEPSLQADFEPQHEASLLADLDKILATIPHQELAIQWDTAVEFALLEGVMPSYIKNLQEGISERLLRLASKVPEPVEIGFHLCYGDSQHKHFCEPEDTGKLVMIANGIAQGVTRQLNWIHMPDPKDLNDDAFFKPLGNLRLARETELYLGLVHYTDGEEGSNRRIECAIKYISKFGVATECGFGRRPPETLQGLMEIHSSVAKPLF